MRSPTPLTRRIKAHGLVIAGVLAAGLTISQPAAAAIAPVSDTQATAPTLSGAAEGVQNAQAKLAAAEQDVRVATGQAQQLAYAVVVLRVQVTEAQVAVAKARTQARHAIRLSVDTASVDPTASFFATLSGNDPDLATQVNNRRMNDAQARIRGLQQAVTRLNALSQGTSGRQTAALAAARRAVTASDKARGLLAAAEKNQVEVRNRIALAAQRQELADLNAQLLKTLAAVDAANRAAAAASADPGTAPGSSGRADIIASSPAALQALFKKAASATCPGLPWQVLAGISQVETGNGQNKNVSSAGAMGPMQFMPATWAVYGIDGDGDGKADILDQADAVYSAGHYLCAAGGGNKATLYQAIFAYNHSDYYVNTVLGIAAQYK